MAKPYRIVYLSKPIHSVYVIPETRKALFLLWLISFFIGEWRETIARPFYRSLVIDLNKEDRSDRK